MLYPNMYMESRKIVLKNLFTGQQWRKSLREKTSGHRERVGEGEMYGESNMDGQRGLPCYVSWGRKELDTTEWLN